MKRESRELLSEYAEMGIKDFLEDAAGAVVAGFEGTDFLKNKVGELFGGQEGQDNSAPTQDDTQGFSPDDNQNT